MILNGSVEVTHPDGRTEILCMGNSFGVSPTMEKEYMKGVMKTKVDDCQVNRTIRYGFEHFLDQKKEECLLSPSKTISIVCNGSFTAEVMWLCPFIKQENNGGD